MTPATLNRVLRRRRRRFASLVIVAALAAAVSAHHLPSGEHGHMDVAEVVAACMAVLPFAAAALAVGGGLPTGRRFALTLPWVPYRAQTISPAPRARSSPVATVVLRR